MTEKIRMITPPEHRFLNTTLARVVFIVKVQGKVEEAKFKDAIKKVQKRHPLLQMKVHYDENHQAWLSRDNPEIPIRVVSLTAENQWRSEMMKEFQIYSEPTKEALIRFVLLKSEETSEFIIFCNHAITDGLSMKYLTRDIMTYLANPEKEVEQVDSISMDFGNVKGLKQGFLLKFIGKKLQGSWEKNPAFFESKHFETSHNAFWRNYIFNLAHKRLNEEQTKILISKCKLEGVTVNSALSTAFRAAIEKHGGYKKFRDNVNIAVNIRNEMMTENKEFFGMAVSAVRTKFKYDFDVDFWSNVKKYHKIVVKKLKKKEYIKDIAGGFMLNQAMTDAMVVGGLGYLTKSEDPGYEDIQIFRNDDSNFMIKLMKKKGLMEISEEPMTGIVITNLGKLDIPIQYGDYRIESIIFVPSAHPMMEIIPGINTINGKLDITLGSYSKNEDDQTEKLEKIMEIALALIFQQ